MKRHGRALHFAVTGALLGGVGIGCATRGGPHTNTGIMGEPEPEEQLHVNPGPDEDPGAAEGGGAEGGAAEGGAAEGGAAEGGAPDEPLPDVNPGPVDAPDPSKLEPSTNNVRKVDEPRTADRPTTKYVNTVRVQDEPKD